MCKRQCGFIRIENKSVIPADFNPVSFDEWMADRYKNASWWKKLWSGGTSDAWTYDFWIYAERDKATKHYRQYQCGACGEIKEFEIV